MKKIHITLVGGQPIPVYLGIVSQECDEVILVHSDTTLNEAKIIEKNTHKPCTFIACAPTDLPNIREQAEKLFKASQDCEVVLNVTSGTKPWTLIFHQRFLSHPNCKIIYIDQLNRSYNLQTSDVSQLDIDLFKRFELYGNPLQNYIPFDLYTDADKNAIRFIEKARRTNFNDFKSLTNHDVSEYESNEGMLVADGYREQGSHMRWNWNEGWVEFSMVSYKDLTTQDIRIELDHPKEIVINTAWFEVKTAIELSKNPLVKKILLNCEFLSNDQNPKNEVDIIADFGTRLLFVECKTMINKITDIDKVRSAMRNYSGTSSTGVFVTNDRVNTNNSTLLNKYMSALEKCRDNDILTFNFGLWDKKPATELNSIINNHINKINKR